MTHLDRVKEQLDLIQKTTAWTQENAPEGSLYIPSDGIGFSTIRYETHEMNLPSMARKPNRKFNWKRRELRERDALKENKKFSVDKK